MKTIMSEMKEASAPAFFLGAFGGIIGLAVSIATKGPIGSAIGAGIFGGVLFFILGASLFTSERNVYVAAIIGIIAGLFFGASFVLEPAGKVLTYGYIGRAVAGAAYGLLLGSILGGVFYFIGHTLLRKTIETKITQGKAILYGMVGGGFWLAIGTSIEEPLFTIIGAGIFGGVLFFIFGASLFSSKRNVYIAMVVGIIAGLVFGAVGGEISVGDAANHTYITKSVSGAFLGVLLGLFFGFLFYSIGTILRRD